MSATDAAEAKLLQIVDEIAALTPAQRRRLLRRLRILGLLEPEEFLLDQDRLRVAPALGLQAAPQDQTMDVDASRTTSSEASESGPADALPPEPQDAPRAPEIAGNSTANNSQPKADTATKREYRSSVSSKVVIAGESGDQDATQSTMAPLPGQAPEQAIGIIFDGGTRGDPALGYGSYAIRWPGLPQQVVRLRFSDDVSGDEAEYDTLIAALEATLQRLQDGDFAPEVAKLDIRGDSHTVLSQVRGDVEIEDADLQLRCDRVRFLLRRFGAWSLSRYHRDRNPGADRSARA